MQTFLFICLQHKDQKGGLENCQVSLSSSSSSALTRWARKASFSGVGGPFILHSGLFVTKELSSSVALLDNVASVLFLIPQLKQMRKPGLETEETNHQTENSQTCDFITCIFNRQCQQKSVTVTVSGGTVLLQMSHISRFKKLVF